MISALVMSFSFLLSVKFLKRILYAEAKIYKLIKTAKEKARKKAKKTKKTRKSKPRFDDDFSYLIK